MGGEKAAVDGVGGALSGSPPHGRGKDAVQRHATGCVGITPAWAGKSREIPLHLRAAKDHPRVGGEKAVAIIW